jgi:hypothetical protein
MTALSGGGLPFHVAEHCRPLVVQPRVGFEMFFDEAGSA